MRGTAPHQPRAAPVHNGRDSLAYILVTSWGAFLFVRNILEGVFGYSRTADWLIGNRRMKQDRVSENHYIAAFSVDEAALSFLLKKG